MDSGSPDDPFKHILPNVHEGVRKSLLILALSEKIEGLPPGAFGFSGELGRLRDVIAPQIGDTRILFPQFTPHDEGLHVVKLFQLADKLFGPSVYNSLNAAELFLLAAALYAHDWGMAVGADEKQFLAKGGHQQHASVGFSPLPDEKNRLSAFCQKAGIAVKNSGEEQISDADLQIYVRDTHARRSAARVRTHFQEFPAVGEALAQLCEGHWLDFATLDDQDRYPRNYEVAGCTVHLLALALQVRIVDLFHITDDRTPFALWRFVSPTDNKSAEEWKKHRALHGISVSGFPPGRLIRIQGFTEDEEVWAALQDLRKYCQEQLQCTLDVAARHVPQRYALDFLKLDWAVTTGQLSPIDFSFNFDREAMFRILSDELYDGDPYVFLRELLQNSIDAIRTRLAYTNGRPKDGIRRKFKSPTFDQTVYFKVTHLECGDIDIVCRDHGIGMDEHIVRNYYTVAGVSYYRSKEFERQNLGFEPISRFGIGVLSCFMVADRLAVTTYRDPEFRPLMAAADLNSSSAVEYRARRLSLEIPGVSRQFIVKELLDEFEIGTEVRMRALSRNIRTRSQRDNYGYKFESEDSDRSARTLLVTEYLSEIAGFVEFPILVEEHFSDGKTTTTLILHPEKDPEAERAQYEGDIEIRQVRPEYPWGIFIHPEDLKATQEVMVSEVFPLNALLQDNDHEGWAIFPRPRIDTWDFSDRDEDSVFGRRGIYYFDPETDDRPAAPIRLASPEEEKVNAQRIRVYRDGILLPAVATANIRGNSDFLKPCLVINFRGSASERTNVARTRFVNTKHTWDASIWNSIEEAITPILRESLELPPEKRIFRIGWLMAIFHLSYEFLHRVIPDSKVVAVWLIKGNKLKFADAVFLKDEVPLVPDELMYLVRGLIKDHFGCNASDAKPALTWQGCDSLALNWASTVSTPLRMVSDYFGVRLEMQFRNSKLRFLVPPQKAGALLKQFIVSPTGKTSVGAIEKTEEQDELSRKALLQNKDVAESIVLAMETPERLAPSHLELLAKVFPVPGFRRAPFLPIAFEAPFDKFAASRDGHVNLNHSFGRALIQCMASVCLAERDGQIDSSTFNEVSQLNHMQFLKRFETGCSMDVKKLFEVLMACAKKSGCVKDSLVAKLPCESEWVPDYGLELAKDAYIPFNIFRLHEVWVQPLSPTVVGDCGELIERWP